MSIPPKISDEIKKGTYTAHLFISSRGVDAWYRSTDPDTSHISYDSTGLLEVLGANSLPVSSHNRRVSFSPDETTRVTDSSDEGGFDHDDYCLSDHSPGGSPKGKGPERTFDYAQALRVYKTNKLHLDGNHGLVQQLPADSLVQRDFERGVPALLARSWMIARKRGTTRIWGIVGNQVNSHKAQTLHQWWDQASPMEKARVLSSRSKINLSALKTDQVKRLAALPYPF